MAAGARRDHELDEDLPITGEDRQESGISSGAGGQQGRSKSEHSQVRGRRSSASLAADEETERSIRSAKEPAQKPDGRLGQAIHNRDPRAPHTANRGSGSEEDEGRGELKD
jgi:hypothetical protein